MSSNIRLKRICQHCDRTFIAKTTVTKFCSDDCAKKNYKKRQKEQKVTQAILEVNAELKERNNAINEKPENGSDTKTKSELFRVQDMAELIGVGERTLYRLIKEPDFPKIKIGKRLLFNRQHVMNYFISKSERV